MSIMSFGADDDKDEEERNHLIKLTSKKTKLERWFKLFREDELPFLTKEHKKTGGLILDFDMSKLEMEYDYDTDNE
jgi:hypothetical protein